MAQADCIKTPTPSLELVICDSEIARASHQELFKMKDDRYVLLEGDILSTVLSSADPGLTRLHIAAGWEVLLKVALWTRRRPLIHDLLGLLKKAGLTDSELGPFKSADITDLFPWLYYGKRFETLRKVCNRAKSRAEAELGLKTLLVNCHLVSEDTGQIVASSL